jgi:hypothetical protein
LSILSGQRILSDAAMKQGVVTASKHRFETRAVYRWIDMAA